MVWQQRADKVRTHSNTAWPLFVAVQQTPPISRLGLVNVDSAVLPAGPELERAMSTYRDTDEPLGAKALNWIVIAGAAVLLLASVAAPAPKTVLAQVKAPVETVVVTAAHANHA